MKNKTIFDFLSARLALSKNHINPLPPVTLIVFSAVIIFASPCFQCSSQVLCAPANESVGSPQTPDINTIIDGLQRKYSRMRGLEAEFVQVYQGANGQTARESGHL